MKPPLPARLLPAHQTAVAHLGLALTPCLLPPRPAVMLGSSPLVDLLGMVAGHAYYFLEASPNEF